MRKCIDCGQKKQNSEVFWHECTYDPYENPCQKIFPWLFTFSIWIYIENDCYLLILAKWKEPGSHFGMYTHITHMNIHAINDFLGTFSIWIYIENYCYLLILAKWKEPGSHFGLYTHITHMNIFAKNYFLGTLHLARINKILFCNDEFIQWLWSNKNSLGYYLFWPRYSYGWYECRF